MLSALHTVSKHLLVHCGWGEGGDSRVGGLFPSTHIPHAFPQEAHGEGNEGSHSCHHLV